MSGATANTTTPVAANGVGERRELGRYETPAGERVVAGQRVNGVVRIVDVPRDGNGRAYLVERELELDGYSALLALVDDYLSVARRYGEVPMATSVVRRCLRELAS